MRAQYNKGQMLENLKNLVIEIADVEFVKKFTTELIKSKTDATDIVDTLSEALDDVGRKYEREEYFLSELMMAGVLATEVTNILKPYWRKAGRKSLGKVVIGTVKGDIHDLGKNIVIMMLRAAAFEVVDLGVDVSAEKFADVIEKETPDLLGLSALLTSTVNEIGNVLDTLKKRGLRSHVSVVVGGRSVTKEYADEVGADGYAKDAAEAVSLVKDLVKAKK